MKNLLLYTAIGFGVTMATLFLPYKTHDYCEGGFFAASSVTESSIHTYGFETFPGYIVMFLFIVFSVVLLVWKNLGTSIAGFVIGLLSLPLMFVMGVGLVFNLNFGSGPCNIRINIGYYVLCLVVLSYVILLLLNMIHYARLRRSAKYNVDDSNLIDDIL